MIGRTHILTGAAAGVLATGEIPGVIVYGVTIEPLIIGGIIGMVAARLPDQLEVLGFRHRHFTHSIWAMILLAVGTWYAVNLYGIEAGYGAALVASYAAHILADALTVAGVHWLAPVRPRWRLRLLPIPLRTGGAVDSLASAAAGAWLLWMIYQLSSPH